MTLPPLVAPGAELTGAERLRYARQLRLDGLGERAQRRLKAARVLVVGAGGLGSPVLLYLAAAGVGTIGVIDPDTVDVTNLQRQVAHGSDDVGRAKVASAADAVRRANPLVTVVEHREALTPGSAGLVAGYDLVVDGSDNFEARFAADAAAAAARIPYVWGAVLRFDGQVSVFWSAAPDGRSLRLRDLFPADPGPVDTCADVGVLGALCGVVGSVMAGEAIKLITGTGAPLLGRVLTVDALDWTFREIPLARAEPAPRTEPAETLPDRGDARAETVSPAELRDLLAQRARGERDFMLVDVREPGERALVRIDGDLHVPLGELLHADVSERVPADASVVLYCHHGPRTRYARAALLAAGWRDVVYLEGGVDAWVREVEPGKPRY